MADNNTNNSKIEIIDASDIISESIDKINENFQTLEKITDVENYKWTNNMKAIKARMDNLENNNGLTIGILNKSIDDLREEVKNTPSLTNIQDEVKKAIRASEEDMAAIVHDLAGTEISTRLGDFAKTTDILSLDSKISGVSDKVANQSTAFESYKSEASSAFAQINHTAANSRYFTNTSGYLVDKDGNQTSYETIEDYFEEVKGVIDPQNKGLGDKDVMKAFLSNCDKHFRTTATEMATIQQTVTSNAASIGLIATIQNDVNNVKTDVGNVKTSMNNVTTDVNNVTNAVNDMSGTVQEIKDLKTTNSASTITAAIFLEANKSGSNITLNANHLNLSGDDVVINTSNFKVNVNNDGAVSVTGAITATALTISSSASNTLASFIGDTITNNSSVKGSLETIIEAVGVSKGWADTTDPYPDGWLKQALSSTSISGGLILTGNLFAGDSDSNITAGVMGATTESNDLRFFAGSSESNAYDAPFRVYEDGSLYASKATITGEIRATALTISSSASNSLASFIGDTITNNSSIKNSLESLVLSVGSSQGWSSGTSVSEYDDRWLTSALSTTSVEGGLLLTGNVFAADASGIVTAGMMGGTTESNNLRFFAGSDDSTASSAPFRVYEDGSLYASKATITGEVSANSGSIGNLKINPDGSLTNGDFTVSPSGKLTATNASITGDIAANRFISNSTISVSTSDFSGELTKKTILSPEEFSISASGTLSKEEYPENPEDSMDVDGSIYIKILDSLTTVSGGTFNGETLYGVPTLCMRLKLPDGTTKEYMLNPETWTALKSTNTTNMRWIQQYSGNEVSFITPTSSNDYYVYGVTPISDSDEPEGYLNIRYYIFRSDSGSNHDRFISYGQSVDIYKFKAINLGSNQTDIDNNASLLYDANLITDTSYPTTSGIYTSSRYLTSAYQGYIGENGSYTPIDNTNINTYKNLIPSDLISVAPSFTYRVLYEPAADADADEYDIPKFGQNMMTFIKDRIFNNVACWTNDSEIENMQITFGELPFIDTTHINTSANKCQIDATIYPITTIEDYGKTHNLTTQVWVKYHVSITGFYKDNYELDLMYSSQWNSFKPSELNLDIYFDSVLTLTNDGFADYDPANGTTTDEVKQTVINAILPIIYKNIFNSSTYYKKIQVTGTISGDAMRSTSGSDSVAFTLKDDGYKPNVW